MANLRNVFPTAVAVLLCLANGVSLSRANKLFDAHDDVSLYAARNLAIPQAYQVPLLIDSSGVSSSSNDNMSVPVAGFTAVMASQTPGTAPPLQLPTQYPNRFTSNSTRAALAPPPPQYRCCTLSCDTCVSHSSCNPATQSTACMSDVVVAGLYKVRLKLGSG
ncbi:hypothetical protein B0T19DRAFT_397651 [Cercophora scortea]|uniref:Uncharacterized protein n=1 Tax=Cercophora scortea TaxID=314031 RepID=A0AAE0IV08_9PEZI|nr:hypothetical protein B0T19DRAFT_397651 [Cercophora scortea]